MSPQVRLQQARARYDRAMRWGRGVEDALADVQEAEAMVRRADDEKAMDAAGADMTPISVPRDKFLSLAPTTQIYRVYRGQLERAR